MTGMRGVARAVPVCQGQGRRTEDFWRGSLFFVARREDVIYGEQGVLLRGGSSGALEAVVGRVLAYWGRHMTPPWTWCIGTGREVDSLLCWVGVQVLLFSQKQGEGV
jgi:hypothetical protein